MKTVIIPEIKFNTYSFSELSEEAKQSVIENFVHKQYNADYDVFNDHEDYKNSLEAFL